MSNPSTTLDDLIQQVRWRCNHEVNQIVTDTELTYYLNGSLGELDDMLVGASQEYKLTTYTADITDPGTPYFLLPDDFLEGKGVDRKVSGVWMTVENFQQPKRNMFNYPLITFPYGYLGIFYRIENQQVDIIPAQNAIATYRLWYIPEFVQLVDGYDILQPYMDTQGWTDYAVVDTCIKVLVKQDLDSAAFERQKAGLYERIKTAIIPRDAGPPKTVQNTRFESDFIGPWGRSGG